VGSLLAGLDVICTQCVVSLWIVAAATLVVAIFVLRRFRRQRHSIVRWSVSAVMVLLALLLASADSVNAYYAYLPTVGDAVQAATGDRQWVNASALARPSSATLRRAERTGLVLKLPIPADPGDGFGSTTSIAYLPPSTSPNPPRPSP
jgi:hypothetical protein